MSWKHLTADAADHAEHKIRFDDNLRGAIVVVLGAVALVGMAFGAMVVLTSPDGWVTKAANTAISGESAQLTNFGAAEAANKSEQPF